jgi:hypothetical protein
MEDSFGTSSSAEVLDESSSAAEAFFSADEEDIDSSPTLLSCLTEDAATPRKHELIKISQVLISSCCMRECLLNLTASDVLKFRTPYREHELIKISQVLISSCCMWKFDCFRCSKVSNTL